MSKKGSFNHPAALATALDQGACASGRPGPWVITGQYRASWRSEVHGGGPV
ncbi:hypothetical protein [Streptomyces sp. NBC_00158]|uniref:hypothetical protein n=1 Tax=Streptomyces sp. NBC_00158 TaxID=2903627 RepID=UPI003251FC1E